ncbi:MAG TPA: hypothetical protein VM534_00835, partial [Thermoanaerobaculia bacterium]|nr:hypothetical protein [Thermoanaerobaculia bacterium]
MSRVVTIVRALASGVAFFLLAVSALLAGGSADQDRSILQQTDDLALASELTSMWTRDAGALVSAIRAAADESSPFPLTFVLAIAHTETHGKILTISEAGAVGLAQATPIAYLAEGMTGPLYATEDYARGARAYFLKKPLYDASTIASMLLDKGDPAREEACLLLSAAQRYRREGVDDLALLVPFAAADHWDKTLQDDARNSRVLAELESLLAPGISREALTEFRDRARGLYDELKEEQRVAWKLYQRDLVRRRDELVRQHFEEDPA